MRARSLLWNGMSFRRRRRQRSRPTQICPQPSSIPTAVPTPRPSPPMIRVRARSLARRRLIQVRPIDTRRPAKIATASCAALKHWSRLRRARESWKRLKRVMETFRNFKPLPPLAAIGKFIISRGSLGFQDNLKGWLPGHGRKSFHPNIPYRDIPLL